MMAADMPPAGADPIAVRLELLESSGQISQLAARLAIQLTERLAAQFAIDATAERRAPFVVHVALALGRAECGEAAPPVPESVKDEVARYPEPLA